MSTQIGAVVRGTRKWMQAYGAAMDMLLTLRDGYIHKTAWGFEVWSGKFPSKIPD